jgi:hypothetical protein
MVAMFVNGSKRMSNSYRGPSIDASYQVSVHLAKLFQRRRFKKVRSAESSLGQKVWVQDVSQPYFRNMNLLKNAKWEKWLLSILKVILLKSNTLRFSKKL